MPDALIEEKIARIAQEIWKEAQQASSGAEARFDTFNWLTASHRAGLEPESAAHFDRAMMEVARALGLVGADAAVHVPRALRAGQFSEKRVKPGEGLLMRKKYRAREVIEVPASPTGNIMGAAVCSEPELRGALSAEEHFNGRCGGPRAFL